MGIYKSNDTRDSIDIKNKMKKEKERLVSTKQNGNLWHKWGPYLTARQWGTVRKDYSANGDAWDFISQKKDIRILISVELKKNFENENS
jgi:hypothetical protein